MAQITRNMGNVSIDGEDVFYFSTELEANTLTDAVNELADRILPIPTELQNLTNAEILQLENIDTVTINNTQWGYLGSMDQGVSTTDSVDFALLDVDNIRIDGNTISSTNAGGDINISPNTTGSVVINTNLEVDNVNIDGNEVSTTSGILTLSSNGGSDVTISNGLKVNSVQSESGASNLTLSGNGASNVEITDSLDVDTINEYTEDNGVIIEGVELKDGEVDGLNVGLLTTELEGLTSSEVQQLQNIDSTTITTTQWGYLGSMDQGVSTTDTPSFSELTIENTNINGNTISTTANTLLFSSSTKQYQFQGNCTFTIDNSDSTNLYFGNLSSSGDNLIVASLGDCWVSIDNNDNSSGVSFRVYNNALSELLFGVEDNRTMTTICNSLTKTDTGDFTISADSGNVIIESCTIGTDVTTNAGNTIDTNTTAIDNIELELDAISNLPNSLTVYQLNSLGQNLVLNPNSGFVVQSNEPFECDNISSLTTNGDLTLSGNGSGVVVIDDELSVDTITGITTSTQLTLLGNLINSTEVGYLATLDQPMSSSSNVQFNTVTVSTSLTTDLITSSGSSVEIDKTLVIDSIINASGNIVFSSDSGFVKSLNDFHVDSITTSSPDTNLQLAGNGTGGVEIQAGETLYVDNIYENGSSGVDIEGVTLKDSLVDNVDITIFQGLTSSEVDQIKNIGSNVINSTRWGYLSVLDQNLRTTDSVQFGELDIDNINIDNTIISSSSSAFNLESNGNVVISTDRDGDQTGTTFKVNTYTPSTSVDMLTISDSYVSTFETDLVVDMWNSGGSNQTVEFNFNSSEIFKFFLDNNSSTPYFDCNYALNLNSTNSRFNWKHTVVYNDTAFTVSDDTLTECEFSDILNDDLDMCGTIDGSNHLTFTVPFDGVYMISLRAAVSGGFYRLAGTYICSDTTTPTASDDVANYNHYLPPARIYYVSNIVRRFNKDDLIKIFVFNDDISGSSSCNWGYTTTSADKRRLILYITCLTSY